MTDESLRSAGILLVILPTVAFGGVSILYLWITTRSDYMQNPVRSRLWAAGHAHAGVFLALSLIALLYIDQTALSDGMKSLVRWLIPGAAILVPAGFFLSTVKPDLERPNALINLAYLGFLSLSAGLLILGIGLIDAA
jgi:hypothetical protein